MGDTLQASSLCGLRDSGYLREERLGIIAGVVNVAREYAFNHATELRWM